MSVPQATTADTSATDIDTTAVASTIEKDIDQDYILWNALTYPIPWNW